MNTQHTHMFGPHSGDILSCTPSPTVLLRGRGTPNPPASGGTLFPAIPTTGFASPLPLRAFFAVYCSPCAYLFNKRPLTRRTARAAPPRPPPGLHPRGQHSRSAAPSTFRCLVAAVDGLTLDSSDTGLPSSRSSPFGSTRSSACRSLGALRPTARRRRGPTPAR